MHRHTSAIGTPEDCAHKDGWRSNNHDNFNCNSEANINNMLYFAFSRVGSGLPLTVAKHYMSLQSAEKSEKSKQSPQKQAT
eukprot:3168428-Amphidinium_carterae.2